MRRGLVASREQAQEAIDAGRVFVGGAPAGKASRQVAPDEPIVVAGDAPRFVGRGGEKLDAAMERFGIDVEGRRCLDAGASTGGFTDCLLQRGATEVVAVDVGYGQLHERLRADPRVDVRDRTNIRSFTLADAGGRPFDAAVADLSFISLRTVMPVLTGDLLVAHAPLVLLVKPQFEAGKHEASKGRGVIRDPEVWRRVLVEVRAALAEHGAIMMDAMVSPLLGGDGNVEFLAHARAHVAADATADVRAITDRDVDRLVDDAAARQER